jgi:ABC-2 type transport system ATP-binding protein
MSLLSEQVPAIAASNLVKQFNTRRGLVVAVDQITLQISKGEIFGLIGPDGAGKTTTIRVLMGLLKRTEGASSVLGYDSMRDLYEIRERVGYIAQHFALPADMTVMENLRFFANVHQVDRRSKRERIGKLLDFAGLSQFADRPAGNLSGGMKKKLALACSLIHEPSVLILDEPTLGVDPISRREFWNLLGNLHIEKKITILVCTPYMDEAERCERVGLMYQGRLVACDSPQEIKRTAPGRLLQLTPSDFQQAAPVVAGLEGVLEVQTYGRMLHVFVDKPERRGQEIQAALRDAGIQCEGIREIDPRMEEAFISLIQRQEKPA